MITKFSELFAQLQLIQDILAELLGICIILIDNQGKEITLPSKLPLRCTEIGKCNFPCHNQMLKMIQGYKPGDEPVIYCCPHNLYLISLLTTVTHGNSPVIVIAGKTPNQNALEESAILLNAIYTLPAVWTKNSQAQIAALEKRSIAEAKYGLTLQETNVLACLATGLSNHDIAERLCISVSTVKSHIAHILQKLRVANRSEAGIFTVKNNLLKGVADNEENAHNIL